MSEKQFSPVRTQIGILKGRGIVIKTKIAYCFSKYTPFPRQKYELKYVFHKIGVG